METKTYTTIDRVAAGWPNGEWDGEPDKMQWPDEATGMPCLAIRHPRSGHWCGYVGVNANHPYFGKGYHDPNVDVHGGLTFADACSSVETEDRGVCHIPGEGEPDHVWWFGFDCAHSGDRSPRDAALEATGNALYARDWNENYKSLRYVQIQCEKLAQQLSAFAAMTQRKSYNQMHADWVAEQRRKNPELAALWGVEDAEQQARDRALEAAALRLFGKTPTSEHECYSAAECLDAVPCIKGRGED